MLEYAVDPSHLLMNLPLPAWVNELAGVSGNSPAIRASTKSHTLKSIHGTDVGLVSAELAHAVRLSARELRSTVSELITGVLESLRRSGTPHPIRMWSFVPNIHQDMGGGLDRYRVFNQGRFDAFCRYFGDAGNFASTLPAASAVGLRDDHFIVCAIGSKWPGLPVQNPRQVPAFGYSRTYGPMPPCFSRGMIARLPCGHRLLVSGTASICGEDSVHPESLSAQFEETFTNIESVARSAHPDGRFGLAGVDSARVYYARRGDREWLASQVSTRLPSGLKVEFVPAAICRPELLVEIEATIAPQSS